MELVEYHPVEENLRDQREKGDKTDLEGYVSTTSDITDSSYHDFDLTRDLMDMMAEEMTRHALIVFIRIIWG